MSSHEAIETAKELLQGISAEQLRTFGIEALRRWRQRANSTDFQIHGHFGLEIVPLLAAAKNRTGIDRNAVKEPFLSELNQSWMTPVIDFTAWLVTTGLAIPLQYNSGNGYPGAYRLTTAGEKLLNSPEDHPFLPGFVTRLVARCSGLPEEVGAHLVDARACLDNGLGRPAISLLGLAYEAAEDAAIDYLNSCGKLRVRSGARAAAKISAVKAVLPKLIDDLEQRGIAVAAWDFADQLRARRNHASHPKAYPDFSDLAEVYEFVVSAGRHLPGLWSVRV